MERLWAGQARCGVSTATTCGAWSQGGNTAARLGEHAGSCGAPLGAQRVENPPAVRETRARSLGLEDALQKETATHSSVLAWRILWTEEPGSVSTQRSVQAGAR